MGLDGFFTTDNRNLAVDSMQAFLIDLQAPGAQPPVDKLNGCQELQLEGTCSYSAASAEPDGDMCFLEVSVSKPTHHIQLATTGSFWVVSHFLEVSLLPISLFSSWRWCLDCLLPVKFNQEMSETRPF